MNTVLYTHDGVFHADDVVCAALLKIYFDKVKIVRNRLNNAKNITVPAGETHYVLDMGGIDLVTENVVAFDHHGDERKEYTNGIKYAACGKLFDYLVEKKYFPMNQKAADSFRRRVLWPIEANDNGQDPKAFEHLGPNLFAWVPSYNALWNEDGSANEQDKRFEKAVYFAIDIISREFSRLMANDMAELEVDLAITKSGEDAIVVFDEYLPWQEAIVEYNKTTENKKKIVIYKSLSGKYNIQMVPIALGTKDTYISCPKNWCGLSGADIQAATGIKEAVFCHSEGFLAGFESPIAAYRAAIKVIEQ